MKKIISTVLSVSLMFLGSYVAFEPELLKAVELGPGAGPYNDTIAVTLSVTEEISLSTSSAIAMPAMTMSVNSSAGGDANSGTWTIKTNSNDGWEIKFHASTTPAMQSASDSFADYHSASSSPTTWSVNAGLFEFGFSAIGGSVIPSYASSSVTTCTSTNNYTPNTNLGYMGFSGTNDILIAQDTTKTTTSGTSTTICVAAGQNGVYADSGSYRADVTATASVK